MSSSTLRRRHTRPRRIHRCHPWYAGSKSSSAAAAYHRNMLRNNLKVASSGPSSSAAVAATASGSAGKIDDALRRNPLPKSHDRSVPRKPPHKPRDRSGRRSSRKKNLEISTPPPAYRIPIRWLLLHRHIFCCRDNPVACRPMRWRHRNCHRWSVSLPIPRRNNSKAVLIPCSPHRVSPTLPPNPPHHPNNNNIPATDPSTSAFSRKYLPI